MLSPVARIVEILEYIEKHLEEKLTLSQLAAKAELSSFHFHRIFQIYTGEVLGEYIRKRRLTTAAKELLGSNKKVIEIALDCGFDSQEAFSRSFKKQFSLSPQHYRQAGRQDKSLFRVPLTKEHLLHISHGDITLKPRFVDLPVMHFVGIPAHSECRNIGLAIRDAWLEFFNRKHEIISAINEDEYGIYMPVNGVHIQNYTLETLMSYLVAVQVKESAPVPAGMSALTIQGGRYAVFRHRGPRIFQTHAYILNTWLPRSGFIFDEREDFGQFISGRKNAGENIQADIYIPIR